MKSLRLALYVLGAIVVALGVGRWQGHREAARDTASQIAAVNGARLADARRWARDSATIATSAREIEERYARIAAQRLDAQLVTARMTIDSARTVLADSAATVAELRAALTETVHRLSLVADMAESYRIRMDSLEARHATERRALARSLIVSDSLSGHWKAEAERLQRVQTCRVLIIPCPTRTQSALLGAGGAVAVMLWAGR